MCGIHNLCIFIAVKVDTLNTGIEVFAEVGLKLQAIFHIIVVVTICVARDVIAVKNIEVTTNKKFGVEHTEALLEVESIVLLVFPDAAFVVTDQSAIESGIAFPVAVLASDSEGYIPWQLHLDVEAVHVPVVKVARAIVKTGAEVEERVLVKVLRDHQTGIGETKLSFIISAISVEAIGISVVSIARETGIEPELSVHFPSAETVFKDRDSLVEAVDLHAEGVEFIL
ncbi:hypothetical protein, partial [uncultured Cloacibacillus sp.]|uniref:hypothetical protein n=1 Tax=uncultured Cloacibacillus sp. TaxID=889794 RepID=UPI0025D773FC